MADYSVFDATAPGGTAAFNSDTDAVQLCGGFRVTGRDDIYLKGARIFLAADTTGTPFSGAKAVFWLPADAPNEDQIGDRHAVVDMDALALGWNDVELPGDEWLLMDDGAIYRVAVFLPAGRGGGYSFASNVFSAAAVASDELPELFHVQSSETFPGSQSYRYDADLTLKPDEAGTSHFFGVDVLVTDDAPAEMDQSKSEPVGIDDSLEVSRSGFSPVTANATAADPLGLDDAAELELAIGSGGGQRVVTSSLLGTRIVMGSVLDNGAPLQGPQFFDDEPITVGLQYRALFAHRMTGMRIYKAPDLAGNVTAALWSEAGALLASKVVSWEADDGGWRTVLFDAPVAIAEDQRVFPGYFSPNGVYAFTPWIFHGQDFSNPPFFVKRDLDGHDGSTYRYGAGPTFPDLTSPTSANFYVDPIAEWDTNEPHHLAAPDYLGQWVNGGSSFDFPVAVFYADPPALEDYMALGVNTLVGNGPGAFRQDYLDAIKASGMDCYISAGQYGALDWVRTVQEDSELAAQVKGYFVTDEPDMVLGIPYQSPELIREWINSIRRLDSTRPCLLNLGYVPARKIGYSFQPPGGTIETASMLWREWAQLSDVVSCDYYNLADENDGQTLGVWTYPLILRSMIELSDYSRPAWGYVETTSGNPGQPTPDQVRKATWAHLIAGAQGIVFFDHRFANAVVSQDFNAMTNDPVMGAAVTALSAQLQTLAPALFAPDAELVADVESSNTTAGPKGGTYGVPMHYTTRVAEGTAYLFAMSIRPGATDATFTIPAAADETMTVIGESRTVEVDEDGVFTDTFAADYTVHLYSWEGP